MQWFVLCRQCDFNPAALQENWIDFRDSCTALYLSIIPVISTEGVIFAGAERSPYEGDEYYKALFKMNPRTVRFYIEAWKARMLTLKEK